MQPAKTIFIRLTIAVTSAMLMSFCSTAPDRQTDSPGSNPAILQVLHRDSIFNSTAVDRGLQQANNFQKAESRKLFMLGLDLLVNKKDASASVKYFREALCYYPDKKGYEQLFSAFVRAANPAMADSVNRILFGRIPDDQVYFNDALISALRNDTSECLAHLEQAIDMGFFSTQRLDDEPLFAFVRDSRAWDAMMLNNFDEEKMRGRVFNAFLKTLPDIQLPFSVSVDSIATVNFDHYIDYDFSSFIVGMDEGRFSRDVSREYLYVGKFMTGTNIAVVYKSFDVIADTLNPVHIYLSLYDSLGEQKSYTEIGCFCSPLEQTTCQITQNGTIVQKSCRAVWEKDPLQQGYAGNRVVSLNETASGTWQILPSGKLSALSSADVALSEP